jgi:thiol-disulfide isomerase/thioredoxin
MFRRHGPSSPRGRRIPGGLSGSAALLLLLAAGCGEDLGPPAVALSDSRPPLISELPEGTVLVENRDPESRLVVRTEIPDRGQITLLFLDRRPAVPLPDQRSAWLDEDGERFLVFDDAGRIADARAADDEAVGRRVPRTRSVEDVGLGPIRSGDALAWSVQEGEPRPLGHAEPSGARMLGQLVNAGRAGYDPRGGAVFAFALRPEVRAWDEGGRERWRSTWLPEDSVVPPRLQAERGSLRIDFEVLQHGIVVTPDGLSYVLAAGSGEDGHDRLLVFDDRGILVREGWVDSGAAVFVDAAGRVFTISRDDALLRSTQAERVAFTPFRVPSLVDEGIVGLESFSGQVVVVNFWASWCPPCRRELPALDRLFHELRDEGVAVVGLNEDVDPAAGREFLSEIGGVEFANGVGRGRLRSVYGYRGLPYTVILDRNHRVVRTIYGFGTSVEPIREAVREAAGADQPHP